MITCLNNLSDHLALLINTAKQNYYSKVVEKLKNTQRSSKPYWSLLKIFLNNKKYLSFHRCITSSSSKLPSKLQYFTQNRLSFITICADDIAKITQNLDLYKAHGHDQISIRMLKICGTSICKPLEIILHQYLETGIFPNVVPVYKKDDKQIL